MLSLHSGKTSRSGSKSHTDVGHSSHDAGRSKNIDMFAGKPEQLGKQARDWLSSVELGILLFLWGKRLYSIDTPAKAKRASTASATIEARLSPLVRGRSSNYVARNQHHLA